MNRFCDRLLPLFRQFLLLPNRSNKFMNLQANSSAPALIISAGIWSIPGDLWLFSLSLASLSSEVLSSGTGDCGMIKIVYSRIISSFFLSFVILMMGGWRLLLFVILKLWISIICDKLNKTTNICRSPGWPCPWSSQIQSSSGPGMISYCTFFSCSHPWETPLIFWRRNYYFFNFSTPCI